jgi:hypothetical protein
MEYSRGAFVVAICFLFSVAGAQSPTTQPASPFIRHIDKQIKILDGGSDAERIEAATALQNLPGEALPQVNEMLERKDLSPAARNSLLLARAALMRKIELAEFERRKQQHAKWLQENMADAYLQVGTRQPKWDKLAREMIAVWIQLSLSEHGYPGDDIDRLWELSNKWVQAKGQDPLVTYIRARNYAKLVFPDKKEIARLHMEVVMSMRPSPYHPYFKFVALMRAAETTSRFEPTPEQRILAKKLTAEAMTLVPQMAADKKMPREIWHNLVDISNQASEFVEESPGIYTDQIIAILEKLSDDRVLILTLKVFRR